MDSEPASMSTATYATHRTGGGGGSSSGSSACTSSSSTPPGMTTPTGANGNSAGSGSNPSSGSAPGVGAGPKMAVIGVTRNVKLRRRGASGFGFSLRGGREYAAGFFVSDVVPGGEAHRNGLRVGDQILRVNGYPVEDAVHQEVALLAKNQQVLVLKIRSVGMIPVKDNPNDPVTWHMVQQQQQQLQFGDAVSNEIRIRILVGEKGRLGCGVCRGIVPGLTVQGTREGGPARAAGLRAGDIILWCNGVSLTDLPFERAIEVMRGASILDLVVNRPILVQNGPSHVYDCPENLWGQPPPQQQIQQAQQHFHPHHQRSSSGYDSEISSLGHGQNVLSPQHHRAMTMASCNRNGRNCCPPNGSGPSEWGHMEQEWTRKQNNTTVIRISQNGGGQGQQHYGHQTLYRRSAPRPPRRGSTGNMYDDLDSEEPIYDPVAPRDFECHDFDANPRDEIDRRAECRREQPATARDYEANVDDVFAKENGQTESNGVSVVSGISNSNSVVLGGGPRPTDKTDRKTVTTVEVHQPSPPAPPSMPPSSMPYKWPTETKPMNAMGMQMGSTMSMGSTGSTETESSLESSCGGKDCAASTSSSLSTSSTASCDQHQQQQQQQQQPPPPQQQQQQQQQPQPQQQQQQQQMSTQLFVSSIAAAAANGAKDQQQTLKPRQLGGLVKVPPPPPPPPIDLGSAITQELQRRAKQRMNGAASQQDGSKQDHQQQQQQSRKPSNPEALKAQEQKVTHDKLMEEFKRAHQRMFSNAQQRGQSAEQGADEEIEAAIGTQETINKPSQETGQPIGNGVDKLTTSFNNKVTIRVNPESNER